MFDSYLHAKTHLWKHITTVYWQVFSDAVSTSCTVLNYTVFTASISFVFWRQICNCARKDYKLQHAGKLFV